MSEIWLLLAGEQIVAELHVTEFDMPWLHARVVRRVGFEAVEPLFAEDLRLLNELTDGGADDAWGSSADAIYESILEATELRNPEGRSVPEYLLHIDGDSAWWRWHDQRFERPAPA